MGDRRVFVEADNKRFINVFALSADKSASHFTVLRILQLLRSFGQEGHRASADYITHQQLFEHFEPQGYKPETLRQYVERMAHFGLLAAQSQDTDRFDAEDTFALTHAGVYYIESLYSTPGYYSEMIADTPMRDEATASYCASVLKSRMSSPKLPVAERVSICQRFVKYLEDCERKELAGVIRNHNVFGAITFVPAMAAQLEKLKETLAPSLFRH
jgi:hypothetical protein